MLWGELPAAANDHSTIIMDAEFVRSEGPLYNSTPADARNLVQALNTAKTETGFSLVGYFRSHIREGLCLTPQDQALIEEEIQDPDAVFLIIKPFDIGICMAGLFFWQNGRLQTDASDLEVPFVALNEPIEEKNITSQAVGSSESENGARRPAEQALPLAPHREESSSIPASLRKSVIENGQSERAIVKFSGDGVSETATVRKFAKWPVWPLLIGTTALTLELVLIGGGAAYLVWPVLRERLQNISLYTPDAEVGLQVVGGPGGELNLSWNRNAPQVRNAQNARLTINDGPLFQELKLDNAQLRSGKLTYFPEAADVQFRLEVYLDSRRTVAESVRVLSPAPKVDLGLAVPRPTGGSEAQPAARRSDLVDRAAFGSKLPDDHNLRAPTQFKVSEPATLRKPEPLSGTREWPKPPDIPLQTERNAASLSLLLAPLPSPISDMKSMKSSNEIARSPSARPAVAVPDSKSSTTVPVDPINSVPSAYVPPRSIRKVMPDTRLLGPSMIYKLTQISVQVAVDRAGRVTAAHAIENGEKSNSLLANITVAAAKQWLFEPAILNGKTIPEIHTIVFEFRPRNP
jgi:hypothetical protein